MITHTPVGASPARDRSKFREQGSLLHFQPLFHNA